MHYAAELGFLHVTKTLVRKHPQLMTMTTDDQLEPVKKRKPVKKRAMLPVEYVFFFYKVEFRKPGQFRLEDINLICQEIEILKSSLQQFIICPIM